MQQVLIVKTDAERNIEAALARVDELLAQAKAVSLETSKSLSGGAYVRS